MDSETLVRNVQTELWMKTYIHGELKIEVGIELHVLAHANRLVCPLLEPVEEAQVPPAKVLTEVLVTLNAIHCG
jgi:hypothetical protein